MGSSSRRGPHRERDRGRGGKVRGWGIGIARGGGKFKEEICLKISVTPKWLNDFQIIAPVNDDVALFLMIRGLSYRSKTFWGVSKFE